MKYDTKFKATFNTDGSGTWAITLPTGCTEPDFDALGPVVQAIRTFLEPTLAVPLPTYREALAAMEAAR